MSIGVDYIETDRTSSHMPVMLSLTRRRVEQVRRLMSSFAWRRDLIASLMGSRLAWSIVQVRSEASRIGRGPMILEMELCRMAVHC